MAVDRAFLTFIIGTDLYAVAIYMVLIGGGLVFLFTILGCFGAVTENRCMLWTVGVAAVSGACRVVRDALCTSLMHCQVLFAYVRLIAELQQS